MISKKVRLMAIVAVFVCVITHALAQAPSEQPKIEWSAQYSALHMSDFDTWLQGVGTRGSYSINRHVSLEGEVNFFFPQGTVTVLDRYSFPMYRYLGERAMQGLLG